MLERITGPVESARLLLRWRGARTLGLAAGLVGLVGLPAAALAQAGVSALNGLSSDGPGRVAVAPFRLESSQINAGTIPPDPQEGSLSRAVAAASTPERVGWVTPQILEREIAARFELVNGCRIDVARRRQLSPSEITADRVTLRWTIIGDGQVAAAEVIGITPVDAEVLDCVKRQVNAWSFPAPAGGDLHVERAFVFPRASGPEKANGPGKASVADGLSRVGEGE